MNQIQKFNIQLPSEELENLKLQIRNDVSNKIKLSNVNNQATDSETYEPDMWKDDYYDFLFDKIDDIINKDKKYKRYSSWLMRYTDNQKTNLHKHLKFKFVAIYYIYAEKGSGCLYFPDLDLEIEPYTGLLVVHDGDISHGVKPNTKKNVERICAVLNYR